MHILVTNDDGVFEPGLFALADAMREIADVTVLGPDRDWSGGGHVKTFQRPLRVKEVTLGDGSLAYASDGAPSDCVALALLGFVKEKIDLVVSGINPYANMGHDVTYSGTVTAAMEAVINGVPGIAFSLVGEDEHAVLHYEAAALVAKNVVKTVLDLGAIPGMLLNVNVPNLAIDQLRGTQVTRQGMRVYNAVLDRRLDPRGEPYYWIGGPLPSGVPDPGTDIGAVAERYVSITPLHLDLTEFRRMQQLSTLYWGDLRQVLHSGRYLPAHYDMLLPETV